MIHRIRDIINKHKLGIILAIITGLIVAGPNLVFINDSSFRGLPMMYADAETWYLGRINGVYNGCILSCNPFIKEYSNVYPFFDSSLSETFLAIPGIISNIPVVKLKIFYEFLLPFLLILLSYSLIFRLTRNITISLFGSSFIVLGYNLINYQDLISVHDFIDLFNLKTDYTQFLIFSRPVNPQFSSVFLFIYLHVLLSTINQRTKKWFFVLTLIYGLSFYIYFFTYAFATVLQIVWLIIFLLRKEWKNFAGTTISTFGGFFIAAPQFIEIVSIFQHPYYITIPKDYLILTHVPHITLKGVLLLLITISLVFIYIKKIKTISTSAYFILALVLACFITRNEHVLTGRIMQYDHFEVYIFSPVLIIVLCFLYLQLLPKWFQQRLYILGIMSVVAIGNASLIQYTSYRSWINYTYKEQRFMPVLEWSANNIPQKSIISSPEYLSKYIPIYTHNYVLWTVYANQWMSVPGRSKDAYDKDQSIESLKSIGNKYKVDYYVQDRKNDLLKKSALKKVYEDTDFIVYKAS